MQLTIDTSSQKVGLALSRGDSIIQECAWYSRENHTRELIPGIIRLLDANNIGIHTLDSIVVARGPGSFNGLRVGMSVAKGLAFALHIPLIGISTLAAEAYLHAGTDSAICPLHEAGRGEIATALFQMREREWQQLKEEHITTMNQLFLELSGETIFCGEITPTLTTELKRVYGEQVRIFPLPDNVCRANLVARLGWQRLTKKDCDDAATLQPLYLRRPPITRPRANKHIIMQPTVTDEC